MTRNATDPLLRTWVALLLLSLLGTALSIAAPGQIPAKLIGFAILAMGWAKARLILLSYLGMAKAPSWRGGAAAIIAFACLVFAALYAAS